jgi:hypothetical protein
MWERKIRVESGVYLFSCPFCPFCFLLHQFSVKLLAQVEKISAASRRVVLSARPRLRFGATGGCRTPSAPSLRLYFPPSLSSSSPLSSSKRPLANRKRVKAPSDTSSEGGNRG